MIWSGWALHHFKKTGRSIVFPSSFSSILYVYYFGVGIVIVFKLAEKTHHTPVSVTVLQAKETAEKIKATELYSFPASGWFVTHDFWLFTHRTKEIFFIKEKVPK